MGQGKLLPCWGLLNPAQSSRACYPPPPPCPAPLYQLLRWHLRWHLRIMAPTHTSPLLTHPPSLWRRHFIPVITPLCSPHSPTALPPRPAPSQTPRPTPPRCVVCWACPHLASWRWWAAAPTCSRSARQPWRPPWRPWRHSQGCRCVCGGGWDGGEAARTGGAGRVVSISSS